MTDPEPIHSIRELLEASIAWEQFKRERRQKQAQQTTCLEPMGPDQHIDQRGVLRRDRDYDRGE